jgi:fructosamine-3-kinase
MGYSIVFDWEAMVVGDPVLDLASCPTWKTLYPREQKLLDGYQSIKSLPDNFELKKNIYKLRTILWKTVYCHRAGILTPERAGRLGQALEPFGI